MCTRLLFEEEKPPAHGRDDNMIWARGSCRIKETSNWAWAGPEVPNDYVLKDTLPPQNVPHSPFPQTQDEKLKKTFCCYNCLDLYHTQSFFPVFVTCFPSSLEQEQCLEKVTNSRPSASNLHNLFSTLLSCSQELGKQVTHTWKNFSHGKSRQL